MGPSLQLSTCVLFWGFLGLFVPAVEGTKPRSSSVSSQVTLTFDLLTLKLVHGVLVSQGPFLPSSVFLGHFVFPLGGGTGQTDGQDQHMMGPPFGKDGPIITVDDRSMVLTLVL